MAIDFDRVDSILNAVVRLIDQPHNRGDFLAVAWPFTVRCERCGHEFEPILVDTLGELVAHVKAGCV